jgi:hypothetical protein
MHGRECIAGLSRGNMVDVELCELGGAVLVDHGQERIEVCSAAVRAIIRLLEQPWASHGPKYRVP